MCSILDGLDTYVPAIPSTKTIVVEEKEYDVDTTKLHKVLLFGDQLTVARIRSAAIIRSTSDTGALDKLEGFIPAVADWHARAVLLDVSHDLVMFDLLCIVPMAGDLGKVLFCRICR